MAFDQVDSVYNAGAYGMGRGIYVGNYDDMDTSEKLARFKHLLELLAHRPLGVIPAIDYTAEYFLLRKRIFGF